jgi:hypothetical protein
MSTYTIAGIIGLSPKAPGNDGLPSFISQLQGQSIPPIFSVYLSNTEVRKGSLQFGGSDVKKYAKKGLTENDVHWANVTSNDYYWTLDLGE